MTVVEVPLPALFSEFLKLVSMCLIELVETFGSEREFGRQVAAPEPVEQFSMPEFEHFLWQRVGCAKRDEDGDAWLKPVREVAGGSLDINIGIERVEDWGL